MHLVVLLSKTKTKTPITKALKTRKYGDIRIEYKSQIRVSDEGERVPSQECVNVRTWHFLRWFGLSFSLPEHCTMFSCFVGFSYIPDSEQLTVCFISHVAQSKHRFNFCDAYLHRPNSPSCKMFCRNTHFSAGYEFLFDSRKWHFILNSTLSPSSYKRGLVVAKYWTLHFWSPHLIKNSFESPNLLPNVKTDVARASDTVFAKDSHTNTLLYSARFSQKKHTPPANGHRATSTGTTEVYSISDPITWSLSSVRPHRSFRIGFNPFFVILVIYCRYCPRPEEAKQGSKMSPKNISIKPRVNL